MIENDWLDFVGQHVEICMYLPVVVTGLGQEAHQRTAAEGIRISDDRRQIIYMVLEKNRLGSRARARARGGSRGRA